MKKRLKKIKKYFFGCGIGLVIGVVVTLTVKLPYFEFDKKINFVHLLSIVTTIFMGVLINVVLSKNNSKNSDTKKVHISKISDVDLMVNNLQSYIQVQNLNFFDINSKISAINRQVDVLKKFDIISNFEYAKLSNEMVYVKDSLTNSGEEVTIKDNIISIDSTFLNGIIDSLERVKCTLLENTLKRISDI